MSGWKKVKNLFWVTPQGADDAPAAISPAKDGPSWGQQGRPSSGQGSGKEGDPSTAEELSDEEFAQLLAGSEHAVPSGPVEAVSAFRLDVNVAGALQIDFQEQYNQAGIPDTDEVEQLEAFLGRLDSSLPHSSKVAAAEAFLGAIGKDRAAVLTDAERKILRVRGLLAAQQAETEQGLRQVQGEIDALSQRIEAHRRHMEELNRKQEAVRGACQTEESRLQAARVFFGNVAKS